MKHLWSLHDRVQATSTRQTNGPLGLTDLLDEVNEGVQCMLVKFFERKAAWLKFTAVYADRPTVKTSRSCYAVIRESKQQQQQQQQQIGRTWTSSTGVELSMKTRIRLENAIYHVVPFSFFSAQCVFSSLTCTQHTCGSRSGSGYGSPDSGSAGSCRSSCWTGQCRRQVRTGTSGRCDPCRSERRTESRLSEHTAGNPGNSKWRVSRDCFKTGLKSEFQIKFITAHH